MPFAGHPTLGTAHVVRALRGGDAVTLEENVGIVPVTGDGDRWTLRAAKAPASARRDRDARPARADARPRRASQITGEPLWVNTGAEQLVDSEIATADDVRRATRRSPRLFPQYARGSHEGDGVRLGARARRCDLLECRFFFSQHGAILEDPATGSACANLGGYLQPPPATTLPVTATLSQGAAVGRPSLLGLRISTRIGGIYVSGNVVELGAGVFDV